MLLDQRAKVELKRCADQGGASDKDRRTSGMEDSNVTKTLDSADIVSFSKLEGDR